MDVEVRPRTVTSLPELCEAVAAHKNCDRTTVLRVRLRPARSMLCVLTSLCQVPAQRFKSFCAAAKRELGADIEYSGDLIILKAPLGDLKGDLSGTIYAHLRACWFQVSQDNLVTLPGGGQRAPDVSARSTPLGPLQRPRAALVPPNLWVEIAYNDRDRDIAMRKIEHDVIPHFGDVCAVLSIVLQRRVTPACSRAAPPRRRVGRRAPKLLERCLRSRWQPDPFARRSSATGPAARRSPARSGSP